MDNPVAPAPINVDEVIEAFNAAHPDVVQEAAPARQPAVAPPQPQPGQEQPQVNAVLPQQEQIIPPQGQIIPPPMPQVCLFPLSAIIFRVSCAGFSHASLSLNSHYCCSFLQLVMHLP